MLITTSNLLSQKKSTMKPKKNILKEFPKDYEAPALFKEDFQEE